MWVPGEKGELGLPTPWLAGHSQEATMPVCREPSHANRACSGHGAERTPYTDCQGTRTASCSAIPWKQSRKLRHQGKGSFHRLEWGSAETLLRGWETQGTWSEVDWSHSCARPDETNSVSASPGPVSQARVVIFPPYPSRSKKGCKGVGALSLSQRQR